MIVVLDRRVNPVIAGLILATLVTSIVAVLDARNDGDLYARLALVPGRVWEGELWRLVTWVFVQSRPIALASACIVLFWHGGDLAATWGTARLARYVAAMVAIAGVGTCVIGLIVHDVWAFPHLAGQTVSSALVIAWALQFPESRIRIYGVLVVGGPVLAYGTVAVAALFAVFYGVVWVLPELLAGGAALIYMTGSHRRWWRSLRRARGRRYGVIDGDRHGGPYQPN